MNSTNASPHVYKKHARTNSHKLSHTHTQTHIHSLIALRFLPIKKKCPQIQSNWMNKCEGNYGKKIKNRQLVESYRHQFFVSFFFFVIILLTTCEVTDLRVTKAAGKRAHNTTIGNRNTLFNKRKFVHLLYWQWKQYFFRSFLSCEIQWNSESIWHISRTEFEFSHDDFSLFTTFDALSNFQFVSSLLLNCSIEIFLQFFFHSGPKLNLFRCR